MERAWVIKLNHIPNEGDDAFLELRIQVKEARGLANFRLRGGLFGGGDNEQVQCSAFQCMEFTWIHVGLEGRGGSHPLTKEE